MCKENRYIKILVLTNVDKKYTCVTINQEKDSTISIPWFVL